MKIDKADVISKGHEGTWKYFISAYNAYEAMRAYRHLIKECLDRKKTNLESIIKGESEIGESEKYSFPPGDLISIDGLNVSLRFLVSIYAQSFFQFGRNSLDYIAQIIAEFYCQDINMGQVDFGAIARKKDSISNESVKSYITSIMTADEYKYLRDYNNTVKHNYDPGVSISVKTDSLDMIGKIPSFEKDSKSYGAAEMDEQMKKIHQFVVNAYGDLLKLIWPEKIDS